MLKQKNKDAMIAVTNSDSKDTEGRGGGGDGVGGGVPYWTIFRQAMPQLFNIFFIFFVTLALFPAVQSGSNWIH